MQVVYRLAFWRVCPTRIVGNVVCVTLLVLLFRTQEANKQLKSTHNFYVVYLES